MLILTKETDTITATSAPTERIETYRFLYGVLMASDLDEQGNEQGNEVERRVWHGENGHTSPFLLLPSILSAR